MGSLTSKTRVAPLCRIQHARAGRPTLSGRPRELDVGLGWFPSVSRPKRRRKDPDGDSGVAHRRGRAIRQWPDGAPTRLVAWDCAEIEAGAARLHFSTGRTLRRPNRHSTDGTDRGGLFAGLALSVYCASQKM